MTTEVQGPLVVIEAGRADEHYMREVSSHTEYCVERTTFASLCDVA